jgi:ubiquinone/menaquinone biosynthesis C-methylase UbiE
MDAKELNLLVHDREAAFYDDRFLIDFDARIARDVERELTRVIGKRPTARRALDVACGTGFAAVGLAASDIAGEIHASDLSIEMVKRTRANTEATDARVNLTQSDAERLPSRDRTFDLVVARGALHHVPNPLVALKEIRRVLEPGGVAVVLAEPTPNGERQTGAVVGAVVRVVESLGRIARRKRDEQAHTWELASIAANLHTFEPGDIATLAEKAGFEDIHTGTASWAWILTLGINYYLMGEFPRLAHLPGMRRGARALNDAALAFDRAIADRVVPADWRHTVWGVLR